MQRFQFKSAGTLAAALLCLGLAGCGQSVASDCGKLSADDAWVRAAPPGAQVMAGYLTLANKGSTAVVVNGVSSTQFDHAAMHKSSIDSDGQAHMSPIEQITVAPGDTVQFKPGARHIMLFSPSQPYDAGDQVEIVLACGSQHAELPVAAVVRADTPSSAAAKSAPAKNTNERAQLMHDARTGGGTDATDDSATAKPN